MGLGEGGRKRAANLWHLVGSPSHKNLGDAVEDYVKRNRIQIPAAGPLELPSYPAQQASVENAQAPAENRSQARHDEQHRDQRQDLWKQAHTLHEQGYGVRTSAKLLGLARNTVRRYLKMEEGWHVAARPKRYCFLDPYRDHLFTRWTAGEHNGNQLTREIRTPGYQGCDTLAREAITQLRKTYPDVAALPPTRPTSQPTAPPQLTPKSSPRQIRWLLAKKPEELSEDKSASCENVRLHSSNGVEERFIDERSTPST
jgi:hypothetical protein